MDDCLDPDGHCAMCDQLGEDDCCICGSAISHSPLPPFPTWPVES